MKEKEKFSWSDGRDHNILNGLKKGERRVLEVLDFIDDSGFLGDKIFHKRFSEVELNIKKEPIINIFESVFPSIKARNEAYKIIEKTIN